MTGITLPLRLWEPGRLCGCGECRFHPRRKCPRADSDDAIRLWSSRERNSLDANQEYSSYDTPDPAEAAQWRAEKKDCVTKFEKGGQYAARR